MAHRIGPITPSRLPLSGRVAVLLMVLVAGITPQKTLFGAVPVDAKDYRLAIKSKLLSQVPLEDGITALELELTIDNKSIHSLYDMRIFLMRAGPAMLVPTCQPARVRLLDAGAQQQVTWPFECLLGPLPAGALRDVQFRVEAVDVRTRKIVTFSVSSRGER